MSTRLLRVLTRLSSTAMATIMVVLSQSPASAQTAVVFVPDLSLDGVTTSVQVRLEDFSSLGSADFRLVFDPSIAKVVSIQTGNLPDGMFAPTNYNNTDGWAFCGWATGAPAGPSGDFILCTITFAPVSTGGPAAFGTDVNYFDFRTTDGARLNPDTKMGNLTVLSSSGVLSDDDEGNYDDTTPRGDTDGQPHTSQDSSPGGIKDNSPDEGNQSSNCAVTTVTVLPSQVLPGQEVTVTADVCNTGDEDCSRTVSLDVNGTAEQSQSIDIPGGQCRQVTFKTSHTAPGTYQVVVGGGAGQFVVLGSGTGPSTVPVPPPAGIGTGAIVAIVVGSVLLIGALVLLFRRRKVS